MGLFEDLHALDVLGVRLDARLMRQTTIIERGEVADVTARGRGVRHISQPVEPIYHEGSLRSGRHGIKLSRRGDCEE